MANLQTKVQKEALQTAIKNYVFKNSMLLLGQRAGVGSKVIDNIITGNFEEVTQLNMERIHKIVAKEAMAEVFKTTDCASMLNIKNAAVKYKQMIGCVGDTGTGKTFIAKKIAEGENVFYYNVHLIASARAFFSDLLANLRIPFSGNVGEMLERVARGFNNLENPVLIIDEADKCLLRNN